jgi:hypothetical protein
MVSKSLGEHKSLSLRLCVNHQSLLYASCWITSSISFCEAVTLAVLKSSVIQYFSKEGLMFSTISGFFLMSCFNLAIDLY